MRNTRFIPVVFEDRDIAHIPTPLRGANRYNIGTKNGYERLYRHLTGQAETPAPDIGQRRRLPLRERQWRSPPQVTDPEPQKKRSSDLERQKAIALSEKDFSAERIHATRDLVVFRLKLGDSVYRFEHVFHHVWFGPNTVKVVLDDTVVLEQNQSNSYRFQTNIDNTLFTFVIYERLNFWDRRIFTISVNNRIILQE